MKKLLTLVAAAAFSTLVPTAHAQTASNNFDVTVNLSSQCRAANNGTQTVDFGTYTAFQAGIQGSSTANLVFDCTRGFAPTTVAFDTVNGTAAGVGVLAGLQYTLTAAAAVVTVLAGVPSRRELETPVRTRSRERCRPDRRALRRAARPPMSAR